MKTIEEAAMEYSGRRKTGIETSWTIEREQAFKAGAEFAQKWIPISEGLPKEDEKGDYLIKIIKKDYKGDIINFISVAKFTRKEFIIFDEVINSEINFYRPIELK